jgi:hypothetical protein
MPKIPSIDSLSGPSAGQRPVERRVIDSGLSGFGETLAKIGAERQDFESRLQYADARAQLAIKQSQLLRDLEHNTGDPSTYEKVYADGMGQLQDGLSQSIKDPKWQAQFRIDASVANGEGAGKVADLIFAKKKDSAIANLNTRLTDLSTQAQSDPAMRMQLLTQAPELIVAAKDAGYLDEVQAGDLTREWTLKTAEAILKTEPSLRQMEILKSGEGVAKYIPPAARQQMMDAAKGDANAELGRSFAEQYRGDYAGGLAAADKIKDIDQRNAAISALSADHARIKAIQQEHDNAVADSIYTKLTSTREAGGMAIDVSTADLNAISDPEKRLQLMNTIAAFNGNAGQPPKHSDPTVLNRAWQMTPDEWRSMSDAQFEGIFSTHLKEADYSHFAETRAKYVSGGVKAAMEKSTQDEITTALQIGADIDPAKLTGNNASMTTIKKNNFLRTEIQSRLDALAGQFKDGVIPPERITKTINSVVRDHALYEQAPEKRGDYTIDVGGEKVRMGDISPSFLKQVQLIFPGADNQKIAELWKLRSSQMNGGNPASVIPDKDLAKVTESIKSLGVAATPEMTALVYRQYLEKNPNAFAEAYPATAPADTSTAPTPAAAPEPASATPPAEYDPVAERGSYSATDAPAQPQSSGSDYSLTQGAKDAGEAIAGVAGKAAKVLRRAEASQVLANAIEQNRMGNVDPGMLDSIKEKMPSMSAEDRKKAEKLLKAYNRK